MANRILQTLENEYSKIYSNKKVIPFHRNEFTKKITDNDKYTVLGLSFINKHFVLVQKTNGLYAIPGGGTEKQIKSAEMLQKAFKNAGCSDKLNEKLINITLEAELDYLATECVREVVEETPIFMMNPIYFGHQKTSAWRDEIIFISNVGYHFTKNGTPEEIIDLSVLSRKIFKPIGKSVAKINPFIILSVKEMVDHIEKVVHTHQIPIAHFLLSLKEESIDVCFAEKKLRAIAGI